MKRDNYKYSEKLVGWLGSFADQQAERLAKSNNIDINELKNAGRIENILDIVNRKKQTSVEEKVAKYRELAGLDLIDTIEKSGNDDAENKEAATKVSRRISLSIRDKTAQSIEQDDKKKLNDIKQFIGQLVHNRNGTIATPAIIEQLEHFMKLNKEWLREHYEELTKVIDKIKDNFKPQLDDELSINDLVRTDEPSRGEKEPPPFLPPASTST